MSKHRATKKQKRGEGKSRAGGVENISQHRAILNIYDTFSVHRWTERTFKTFALRNADKNVSFVERERFRRREKL